MSHQIPSQTRNDASELEALKGLRRTILEMVYRAKEGHVPSAFSILEILYVLYRDCLHYRADEPRFDDRDYFVLSKGHAGAGLYAVLSHFGFMPKDVLLSYCQSGSPLGGHPDRLKVPGVEVSSGSLGHGIAIAAGIGLGLKQKASERKVVVLVGDGEMDEGSFWESLMMIRNLHLTNIIVIADCNGSQKYSYAYDWSRAVSALGWQTRLIENGHDLTELRSVLVPATREPQAHPLFIEARTTKGYGVQRLIGDHGWHRRTPTEAEMQELLSELAESGATR